MKKKRKLYQHETFQSLDRIVKHTDFHHCIFVHINFADSVFHDCNFYHCIFMSGIFSKAKLLNNSFFMCDFGRMSLDTYAIHNLFQGCNISIVYLQEGSNDNRFIGLRPTAFTSANGIDQTFPQRCPQEGSFIAFKALRNNKIAKLIIPEDAKRSSGLGNKCRASKVIVKEIYDLTSETFIDVGYGIYNHLEYRVGQTVTADFFDENKIVECSNGIHFFITKQEAIEYSSRY